MIGKLAYYYFLTRNAVRKGAHSWINQPLVKVGEIEGTHSARVKSLLIRKGKTRNGGGAHVMKADYIKVGHGQRFLGLRVDINDKLTNLVIFEVSKHQKILKEMENVGKVVLKENPLPEFPNNVDVCVMKK
jgi:hypothetical protein